MNSLIFPEGITYKYRYVTGGDYVPVDMKFTSIDNLYRNAKNNIMIVGLDTSDVTDMSYMFYGCSNLTSISQFYTSKAIDMSYMFQNCSNLTSVPQLDTSNVTNMNYMFAYCSALTSIPQLDTSKVTNMSSMFSNCSKLTSVPQLDTSNAASINDMFSACSALTSIPQLDTSKVTNIGIFGYSGSTSIVNLGGFVNLGMQKSVSNTTGNYFLGASSKLTHESIMNVINNLYDRKTAGYSVLTLKLHANVLALLSDEEKAIATNKGWTLS